jgi:hypothetical protein
MRIFFTYLLIFFAGAKNNNCQAQLAFVAQSSSQTVGMQSTFQISFTIQNANAINQFSPPNLNAFAVVAGPMQSSSFSNINGASTSSISYTYYLQPKQIGNFTIPAAIAIVDGKRIQCNTINIKVVKGNTPASKNVQAQQDPFNDPFWNSIIGDEEDKEIYEREKALSKKNPKTAPVKVLNTKEISEKVFAQIDVDKTTAYQGEQITASYNVYSQLPLEAGFKKLNSPEGFWNQDFTKDINPQAAEKVIIKGKEYRKYTLRKTALFANKSGLLTLPSTEIQCNVEIPNTDTEPTTDGGLLGGLFEKLLGESSVQRVPLQLSTAPVELQIKPLPSGDINGTALVGIFGLEGNVSKTEMTTDETTTLQYTIQGSGNISLLPSLSVSIPGDFEPTEPRIFDTITAENMGSLQGYKTYTYTLSPRNAGTVTIPAVQFTFFNAQTQQYQTISSPAYTIKILPGKKNLVAKTSALPSDIHDIISNEDLHKKQAIPLLEDKAYWSLFGIPLGLLLISSIAQGRKNSAEKRNQVKQQKNVSQIAEQRLSLAAEMQHTENKNGFYNEMSKAIWLYISDKVGVPLSKLNKEEAWHILQQKGVELQDIEKLQQVAKRCEEAPYSPLPISESTTELYNTAKQCLVQIENHVG